jgi:uroporphyrinogen-III synthase
MPAERPAGHVTVLITRPAEDAAPLADSVRAAGLVPVIESLLGVAPTGEPVSLDGVQAVLLTSANGARALAAAIDRRDVPVFAVGDATARAARGAGFAAAESAAGNVDALAALVRRRCVPDRGVLLHVSGRDVAGNLAGLLADGGFAVRRAVLYRAEAATALSAETRAEMAAGRIAAALFFSPRTARSFVTLATAAGLGEACRRIAAFCLSPAVAVALAHLSWRTVRTAAAPTQPALLDALTSWVAEGQTDRGSA